MGKLKRVKRRLVSGAVSDNLETMRGFGPWTLRRRHSSRAWLRRTPRINDYLIALVDGTPLEVVGPDVEAEGRAWKNVRDPQGNQGFVPAEWVVPVP